MSQAGKRVREVPRPLALLLGATAILGVAWALFTPAWQSPDEQSHFGYVQTLAEDGRLPDQRPGRVFSTEQQSGAAAIGFGNLQGNLRARAPWFEPGQQAWDRRESNYGSAERSDGGGAQRDIPAGNPARVNPPLYYAYEAVPYLASPSAGLFDRFFLMRLWSGLLFLVAVAGAWLLVGEVMGRRRDLQLIGASFVGLVPMLTFIGTSVTPDAMLFATFALVLWLGVRIIRRGLKMGEGVAICALTAAAILTKSSSYALVPGVLFALFLGAREAGLLGDMRGRVKALVPLAALGLPVLAWIAYTRVEDRPAVNPISDTVAAGIPAVPNALSYLWQFYLPQLPGMTPLPPGFSSLPVSTIWLEGSWGKFGWLEISLPAVAYVIAGVLTAAALGFGTYALIRAGWRRHLPLLAFFVLIAGALLAGLHVTEYRSVRASAAPLNQGRYLLPLFPLLGLAAAAALGLLRGSRRAVALGGTVGLLFALQLVSLAVIAGRFYV